MKTRISGKEAARVAEDMAKPGPIRVVAASEAQEVPGALVPSPVVRAGPKGASACPKAFGSKPSSVIGAAPSRQSRCGTSTHIPGGREWSGSEPSDRIFHEGTPIEPQAEKAARVAIDRLVLNASGTVRRWYGHELQGIITASRQERKERLVGRNRNIQQAAVRPRWYFPDRKPRERGAQTRTPSPNAAAAGMSSRSAERWTSDHWSWMES
jgi:hypothetical protein